jgi:hypothetical protein
MIGRVTAPLPRDDRVLPRGSRVIGAAVLGGAAAGAYALSRDAGPDTRPWVVLVAFGAALALSLATVVAGMPPWLRGGRPPRRVLAAQLGILLGVVVAFGVAVQAGWAALVGLLAGLAGSGLVTVPMARRNRPAVDAAWAEREAERLSAPAAAPARTGPAAPVGTVLRLEVYRARRRLVSAVLSTLFVTAAVAVGWRSPVGTGMTAFVGVVLAAFEVRGLWGRQLSLRAYESGRERPLVGWVALLSDPNPRAVRPLLAVWDEEPVAGPGRFPKPDRVYRADDDADDLLSVQGSMSVHRAWLAPSRGRWSTPRWVAADAGVAIPHRPALLGRWYFGSISRAERAEPRPLTVGEPNPMAEVGDPPPPWSWPTFGSLAGRTAFLAAWAVVAHLVLRGR